jgi:hypothetical protein
MNVGELVSLPTAGSLGENAIIAASGTSLDCLPKVLG